MNEREREARKWILKILDRAFLDGAGTRIIRDALHKMQLPLSLDEVEVQVRYLHIKGYIHIERVEVEGVGSREILYLTPAGKDLLEGNIDPDPGVAR